MKMYSKLQLYVKSYDLYVHSIEKPHSDRWPVM